MTPKATSHVIQGMQKDTSKSKLSKEFAFHNHNIRITAREDSTLLSVTNEKGTTSKNSITGIYIGHCIIQDNLILFSKDPKTLNSDLIYLINYNTLIFPDVLYNGYLNFSLDHPIEALGVYENEDIQKVYWVDGLNQPRVINIAAEKKIKEKWNDSSFDFIPELALQESVSVEAVSNSSMFAPGVIQYAFSYYNKYGQESNIFNTTPLCYLTHSNRGASPEETIRDLAFKIKVTNLDTKFDYVRIYSIHRTSLNAVPTCKRVIDLPVKIPDKYTDIVETVQSISFGPDNNLYVRNTDTNEVIDLVTDIFRPITSDNITTYYLNEHNVSVPNNYDFVTVKLNSNGETEIDKVITGMLSLFKYVETKTTYNKGTRYSYKLEPDTPTQYYLNISYKKENNQTPYIEYIDNGTLGDTIDPTQLLYIGGEDIIAGTITAKDNTLFLGNIELKQLAVDSKLKTLIKNINISSQSKYLKNNEKSLDSYHYSNIFINDYSYFKPGEHYRLGIQLQYKNGKWSEPIFINDYTIPLGTNPTINATQISLPYPSFTLTEEVKSAIKEGGFKRIRGLVVFPEGQERKVLAQGILCPTVYNEEDRENNKPYSQSSWFIRPNLPSEITGFSSNDDFNNIEKGSIVEFRHNESIITGLNRGSEIQNGVEYKVDQSILTFHSPEIEFDDSLSISNVDVRMRIVGIANFNKNYGYIDIQTKTPQSSSTTLGVYTKSISDLEFGGRSLVSGLFYQDKLPDSTLTKYYLVYPWHRSGSVNADNASLANSKNRTQFGILEKKKISNYKFSSTNTWLEKKDIWEALSNNSNGSLANGISKIHKFDSDQVELIKLDLFNDNNPINYYGNIDSLVFNPDEYNIIVSESFNGKLENVNIENVIGTEPVRIKYKSSPHYVLGLRPNKDITIVLPTINNLNSKSTIGKNPSLEIVKPDTGKEIKYKGREEPTSPSEGDLWLFDYPIVTNPNSYIIYYRKGNKWSSYDGVEKFNLYYIDEKNLLIEHYYYNQAVHFYCLDKIENALSIEVETPVIQQDSILLNTLNNPFLYIAELYVPDNFVFAFGGTTEDAIKNNQWIPASRSYNLDSVEDSFIYEYGDTRYQRYDCLKTYAFTPEDENQVIEIASFMCETRYNLLGRYDKNIGNLSNLNADPTNFNLFNPVYSQKDNFFNYRILDSDLYKLDKFDNTITWSKEKYAGEDVDTWTNITMANTLDLDGTKGKVNKLTTIGDTILCFQDKGFSQILFNSRVQIPVSDGVPVEITNGYKVDGYRYISDSIGCQNKNSIITTPSGVYFLDGESGGIYNYSSSLTNLSTQKGFDVWTKEVSNDPTFKSFYDKNNKDVYFNTDTYSLCYSEKLGNFTSFYDYNGTKAMFNVGDSFYSLVTKYEEASGYTRTHLYKMFNGPYNNFFGEVKPYSVTIISNEDPQVDKVFTNLDYRADFFDSNNNYLENESFDTLEVWNEYQRGKETLKYSKFRPSNLKKKFRMWGANIPRDKKNKLDRMRNPWLYIKLSKENPGTSKMELHDLVVKYLE